MRSLPTLYTVTELFSDEQKCIQYLFEHGAFYPSRECPKCGQNMKRSDGSDAWRCTKSKCGGQLSIRRGSFFSKSRLECRQIMCLAYLWLNKIPTTSIIAMTGTSSATVTAFNNYFRNLVADSLEQEDCVIGGPGVIVELDESKLGKRKYNRGHRVDGVWVLGGIERTPAKKVFIEQVEDRSAETLLEVIGRRVLPGSVVFTDMWRGYSSITELLGHEHRVVNHSVEFVSIDGTHTNTIEATWCGLKLMIPKRNRTQNVEGHLWEYIWRKTNTGDIWNAFLDALKEVSYE